MADMKKLHKFSKELNLLYVEDDELLRENIYSILEVLFKKVDTAQNGEEGLKKYNDFKYDIVLTDLTMPKINGLELIKQIREIDTEQKVVVLTAHNESEKLIQLIKEGVNNFILKPSTKESIFTALLPVCRDAYNQILNVKLAQELVDLNDDLKERNRALTRELNSLSVKNTQIEQLIEEKQEQKEDKNYDGYFDADEQVELENVYFLEEHGEDIKEMFTEIPDLILFALEKDDESYLLQISDILSRVNSVLLFYTPYIDMLASSMLNLSISMAENTTKYLDVAKMDPDMIIRLFDSISSDMEKYVERFSKESMAMKNVHHIHKPTALSIEQIILFVVPPHEDEEDSIEFF